MKKIISVALLSLLITGCAVKKEWGSSGGSKADGVVELSYTYGGFEKPELDDEQGLQKAIKICNTWNYRSAQAFDFINTNCQSTTIYGDCSSAIVTKKYQCIN